MPINVDAITPTRRSLNVDEISSSVPPKKKSFMGGLLTGPKETLQAIQQSGETTPGPVGAPPFAIGLARGMVEFPFQAAKQFARSKEKYGPFGAGLATAEAILPATTEFARNPSLEQGSRAGTELLQYAIPGALGKAGKVRAPKPKVVATDFADLAKVKDQIVTKQPPAVPEKTKLDVVVERRLKDRGIVPDGEFERFAPPAEPVAPGGIEPPKPPAPVAEAAPPTPEGSGKIINPKVFGDLSPETRKFIGESAEQLRGEAEKVKAGPISTGEIVERVLSVKALDEVVSREQMVDMRARSEKLRQDLGRLAEDKSITPEYIDTFKKWINSGENIAGQLQSRKIAYAGEGGEISLAQVKNTITKRLLDAGKSGAEIIKEAEGVDFTNANETARFVRKFMDWREKFLWDIDTFRYGNMLSGPLTHVTNTLTNAMQVGGLKPAVMLVKSMIDPNTFAAQVPAYLGGARKALRTAMGEAGQVMRGEVVLGRPDIRYLPNPNPLLKAHRFILEAMEASDIFFRRVAGGGIEASMRKQAQKLGKEPPANIGKVAMEQAAESIFRKPLDPSNKTGQGYFNSSLDRVASAVETLRRVPGMRWTIPFLLTIHNIFKQGVQYTPVGAINAVGAADKAEYIARSLVGSGVFATIMAAAQSGKIKVGWKAPTDKKQRELFYAEGNLPFQIEIGNTRVQYSRIGPLAYPIAMVAAIKYYTDQDPNRFNASVEKKVVNILSGTAEFFASQLYMDEIEKWLQAVKGDEAGLAGAASNYPRQVVPFVSFLGWLDRMMDTTYRKASREFSIEGIIQNIKRQLPVLSEQVEPYTQPGASSFAPDVLSVRQLPFVNAVSPFSITKRKPEYTERLGKRQLELEERAKNKE